MSDKIHCISLIRMISHQTSLYRWSPLGFLYLMNDWIPVSMYMIDACTEHWISCLSAVVQFLMPKRITFVLKIFSWHFFPFLPCRNPAILARGMVLSLSIFSGEGWFFEGKILTKGVFYDFWGNIRKLENISSVITSETTGEVEGC